MTYKEILKSVGYPEDILVLDFETYFDSKYNFKKMSTIEYIRHPKFAFTGLGIRTENKPAVFNPPPILECPSSILNDYTIVVANAQFDITVLQEKFDFVPKYIIDIQDLARHWDSRMSHKLKDLAKLFKLKPKGDTKQFSGLHWEDMSQEQRQAMIKYSNTDCDDEFELFKILLPKLTNPKIELALARHTLDIYLNPKIVFDFGKAIELKEQMHKRIDTIISETGYSQKLLSGDLSFVKLLQETLPKDERIPIKPGKPGKNMVKLLGCEGMIPALAQNDDGMKFLLTHSNEKVRQLSKARQMIGSWPNHIKRINNMTNQAIVMDGVLRLLLHYYGGHTGRWSGGGGINPQNLGGRGRAGVGVDPLISGMRSLFRAPEDNTFLIADSAQIEARVLAWLAGQEDLIQDFIEGKSPYCTLATKLFKEPVHKPTEEEKKTKEGQIMAVRYGFGKDGILGCGYGMGAAKFYQRCLENPSLRPLFDSGEYNFEFIKKLIDTYRTTYKKIPEFWREVEKAFKIVVKYPYEKRIIGNLQFSNYNGTVHLRLPSGRVLYYRNARIVEADGYSTIQYRWGHLWGGGIVENIVQSVARDLLGYWILESEEEFPVVLHSHDEIVAVVSTLQSGPCCLYDAINIMRTAPNWAEGLPLDAEGELSNVYKK